MKKTRLLYLIFSLLVISFTACLDEDNDGPVKNIKQKELPEEAKIFLNVYLPNNKYVSGKRGEIMDGDGPYVYDVTLAGDVSVSFNSTGRWNSVVCEKGLPETVKSLLHNSSLKQLQLNYPNSKITDMQNGSNSVFVMLDNSKKLWDMYGLEEYVLAEVMEDEAELPEAMLKLFDIVFASNTGNILKYNTSKGIIYSQRLGNLITINYDAKGEWMNVLDNSANQTFIQLFLQRIVPQNIIETLTVQKPTGALTQVSRFDNSLYCFKFGDKNFYMIDTQGNLVQPPIDEAKSFIKKTFELEQDPVITTDLVWTYPFGLFYQFVDTRGIGIIIDGTMDKLITALWTEVSGGITRNRTLPRGVIEMLPVNTVKYLDDNKLSTEIRRLSYSGKLDEILLFNGSDKLFYFSAFTGDFLRVQNSNIY